MKTISRSRALTIIVEVSDARLKAMAAAPELASQAIQAGADYWHTRILPDHFDPPAHATYGYARRSAKYNKQKHGRPDLVFSGSLRRDLKARAKFVEKARAIELTMTARVLNFVPRMNNTDENDYVQHKNGRGYPNLKREVRAVSDDEVRAIAAVVASAAAKLFDPEGGTHGNADALHPA